MKITRTMVESISNEETSKKFNKLISDAEEAARREIELEVKKQFDTKIPQLMIDEGYVKVGIDVRVSYDNDDDSDLEKYWELYNPHPQKAFDSRFEIKASKKIAKLVSHHKQLEKDSYKFRCDLRRVIGSFSTHNALLVHLPELKSYFADAELAKSMAVVPVEQIKEIRSQLVAR